MKSKEIAVALMLGGNLGNTPVMFREAIRLLTAQAGHIEKSSSLYISEPWGLAAQPLFKNQAIVLQTKLSPKELLTKVKEIEKTLGRKTTAVNGPREIDIDILLYGSLIVHEAMLQIPHPRLHLRKFNLEPLSEIASGWVHPGLNKTIGELNDTCVDTLSVKIMPADEAE